MKHTAIGHAVDIGRELADIEKCIWRIAATDAGSSPSYWADQIRRHANKIAKAADQLSYSVRDDQKETALTVIKACK